VKDLKKASSETKPDKLDPKKPTPNQTPTSLPDKPKDLKKT
jgi:hypothetical protein